MSLERTSVPNAGGGVWKNWDADGGSSDPFAGTITVGNGILVARYWTPAPVVPAFSTPPFLVFIYVALKFGSTTTVNTAISVGTPDLSDFGFEIDPYLATGDSGTPDPFNNAGPTFAQALIPGSPSNGRLWPGVGVAPTDAAQIVTLGDPPDSADPWGPTVPATWIEGSYFSVQRTYLGAFYGD